MIEIEPVPFVELSSVDRAAIPALSAAMWNTVDLLKRGAEADNQIINDLDDLGIEVTDEDRETAMGVVQQLVSGNVPGRPATNGSMLLVGSILREFSHRVADDAAAIREVIKNKLLIETEHPDPKVRLKAIELLGKIGEVGAFVERSEVTVTHQTVDERRAALREKLLKIRHEIAPAIEAEFREVDGEEGEEGEGE